MGLNRTLKIILKLVIFLVVVAIITGITFWMSKLLFYWLNYPRGHDAIAHIFRVTQIAKFYPHDTWIHTWAGGMPLFYHYPKLLYFVLAMIERVLTVSPQLLLALSGIFAIIFGAMAIFSSVYLLTKKSWTIALVSALIFVSTPGVFGPTITGGLYSRAFAVAFFTWTIYAALRFFKKRQQNQATKFDLFLIIALLSLSILLHPTTVVSTILIVLVIGFAFYGRNLKALFFDLFKIIGFSVLIDLFYILPFFVYPMYVAYQPDYIQLMKNIALPWSKLFYLFSNSPVDTSEIYEINRLSPFLYPLVLLLWIILLIFSFKKIRQSKYLIRLAIFLTIASLLALWYAKGSFPIGLAYKYLGAPDIILYYIPQILAICFGILWWYLWPRQILSRWLVLIFIPLIIFWIKTDLRPADLKPTESEQPPQPEFSQLVFDGPDHLMTKRNISHDQFNFRYADSTDGVLASWFNIEYPYTPQTRDYFVSGVLNIDDYTYLNVNVWDWPNHLNEAVFNLDWWGVKQLIVKSDSEVISQYQNSDDFKYLDQSPSLEFYQFKNASPVLSTTNTPSVLVIGQAETNFDTFFRSLALNNFNSQYFIPVIGKENIDDYNLAELQHFDGLLLYGYDWKNQAKAEKLLLDYVEGGGGLFIEANRDANTEVLDVFPVSESANSAFGKEFKLKEGHQSIVKEVDYSKFSETIYDDKPWGMVQANEVKNDAKVILYNYDKPVLISQKIGSGNIIWSGINLPYHILMYNNQEEAKLLGQLMGWVVNSENQPAEIESPMVDQDFVYETESYKTEFINPEKRIVTIKKPASGVLFKENYFQNWRAEINNQNLEIYQAGPKFMYIPLGNNVKEGDQLILEYKERFWPERFSLCVSILASLVLLMYVFGGKFVDLILEKLRSRVNAPIKKTSQITRNWWEEDENDY